MQWTPSPVKPSRHAQKKLPGVLEQAASGEHPVVLSAHSSMSAATKMRGNILTAIITKGAFD